MYFGRVVGSVWATVKNPAMTGCRMLVVQPLTPELQNTGKPLICTDCTGAGAGELVYWVRGKEASFPFHPDEPPVDTTVVGIDEAQFLDEEIVPIVRALADRGVRVIIAGLDQDFRGEPFGCMPLLMAFAERVEKLQAICMVCGEGGTRTQRLVNGKPARYDDPVVIVGAAEMYEARCRKHHQVPRD